MASLSIRRIDDGLYERLRQRAARRGVSMEEEVRAILRSTLGEPERLSELALECFGPDHGIELELPPREPHEPADLP